MLDLLFFEVGEGPCFELLELFFEGGESYSNRFGEFGPLVSEGFIHLVFNNFCKLLPFYLGVGSFYVVLFLSKYSL